MNEPEMRDLVDKTLQDIDAIAREYDPYDYGLPLYDVGKCSKMQDAILALIQPLIEENEELKEIAQYNKDSALNFLKTITELTIENAQLKVKLEKAESLIKAAKNYIDENPCDRDITREQAEAWEEYQKALSEITSPGERGEGEGRKE